METELVPQVVDTKQFRQDLDAVLQQIREKSETCCRGARSSRERSLAMTKLQEAIMWLGMDLKAMREEGIGGENPYPESYNPASPAIEPPADNLKL